MIFFGKKSNKNMPVVNESSGVTTVLTQKKGFLGRIKTVELAKIDVNSDGLLKIISKKLNGYNFKHPIVFKTMLGLNSIETVLDGSHGFRVCNTENHMSSDNNQDIKTLHCNNLNKVFNSLDDEAKKSFSHMGKPFGLFELLKPNKVPSNNKARSFESNRKEIPDEIPHKKRPLHFPHYHKSIRYLERTISEIKKNPNNFDQGHFDKIRFRYFSLKKAASPSGKDYSEEKKKELNQIKKKLVDINSDFKALKKSVNFTIVPDELANIKSDDVEKVFPLYQSISQLRERVMKIIDASPVTEDSVVSLRADYEKITGEISLSDLSDDAHEKISGQLIQLNESVIDKSVGSENKDSIETLIDFLFHQSIAQLQQKIQKTIDSTSLSEESVAPLRDDYEKLISQTADSDLSNDKLGKISDRLMGLNESFEDKAEHQYSLFKKGSTRMYI